MNDMIDEMLREHDKIMEEKKSMSLAELGADLPLSIVIKEEDKYYEIDDITYDYVINEFVLVVKDGTGARYSTRGDIL